VLESHDGSTCSASEYPSSTSSAQRQSFNRLDDLCKPYGFDNRTDKHLPMTIFRSSSQSFNALGFGTIPTGFSLK